RELMQFSAISACSAVYGEPLSGLTGVRLQSPSVAENVGRCAGREIGEFGVPPQGAFTREPALLQDMCRWPMIDVAQGVQADYAAGHGHLDHGTQRLGCEPPAPGILGEHVPGCCTIDCLEREPRPAEESAVLARKRKVRPDRPLAPFL